MTGGRFLAIAFDSTHLAIKVERRLKGIVEVEMIPTPRSITSSCGLSIKTSGEKLALIIKELGIMDIDRELIRIYDLGDGKHMRPKEISWRE
jgi:hypothetical protein